MDLNQAVTLRSVNRNHSLQNDMLVPLDTTKYRLQTLATTSGQLVTVIITRQKYVHQTS